MEIKDKTHVNERSSSQCAESDGITDLLYQVHLNFAKRVKLCIESNRTNVEDINHYWN